jgi:N4-(beta-N-acetylglucosaminyl)-L-asparaginase
MFIFFQDVLPNPTQNCGPYTPIHPNNLVQAENYDSSVKRHRRGGEGNHDTIGMVAIDDKGHVVAGTSTNGLKWKIPGYCFEKVSFFH